MQIINGNIKANLKVKFKGANWKGNSAWGIKGNWRQFEKANLNGNFYGEFEKGMRRS